MKVSARGSALEPHGRGLAEQQVLISAAAPAGQDLTNRLVRKGSVTKALQRLVNRTKSRVRARVEHDFAVDRLAVTSAARCESPKRQPVACSSGCLTGEAPTGSGAQTRSSSAVRTTGDAPFGHLKSTRLLIPVAGSAPASICATSTSSSFRPWIRPQRAPPTVRRTKMGCGQRSARPRFHGHFRATDRQPSAESEQKSR